MKKILALRLDRQQWIDFAYLTVILIAVSLPLIVFRPQKGLFGDTFFPIFADSDGTLTVRYPIWLMIWFVVGIGLIYFWNRTVHRIAPLLRTPKPHKRYNALKILAIASLYIVLLIVVYYFPMREHFWHGYDDPSVIMAGLGSFIDEVNGYDLVQNRPLAMFSAQFAVAIAPGRIDGFIWFAYLVRRSNVWSNRANALRVAARSSSTIH
jgi:hypothetical protein